MEPSATAPKVFISYSWANSSHEDWVLNLATELRESGIKAILDKWDLKHGYDASVFMERMVTDESIQKVILVCEKTYAEKADKRVGGVGTETQIISPEIYANQKQEKFVAVVTERDEEGKPYLPTYYKSKVYIDFSDSSAYAESFEQLLRCIYDKPLHKKPPLGSKPDFLEENALSISLATSFLFRRALDAVRNQRPHLTASVSEYFTKFSQELEKFRIDFSEKSEEESLDEVIVENIEAFTPYRYELVQLFIALAMYQDSEEIRIEIHRFFEKLIPY